MNAPSLSDEPPGFGACAYGPGVSALVDAQSATGGTVEIVGSVGVERDEAFSVREDARPGLLGIKLGEIIGSVREVDDADGTKDGIATTLKPRPSEEFFAGAQKDLVDAGRGVRRHTKLRIVLVVLFLRRVLKPR